MLQDDALSMWIIRECLVGGKNRTATVKHPEFSRMNAATFPKRNVLILAKVWHRKGR